MSKELIEEILDDLEKLKQKCYNVSFETADFKDASHYSFTFDKLDDLEKHVVCVNGVVFEKRISPTLRMLEDVYADRKFNKKIMLDKKEELKAVMDEIKELEAEL